MSDVTEGVDVAGHTLARMRRLDKRVDHMADVLVRHGSHLERIDCDLSEFRRDFGDLRADFSSMEGRFLGLPNDVIALREGVDALVVRADPQERMITAIAGAVDDQTKRIDNQTTSIDGLDQKLDMILAKLP